MNAQIARNDTRASSIPVRSRLLKKLLILSVAAVAAIPVLAAAVDAPAAVRFHRYEGARHIKAPASVSVTARSNKRVTVVVEMSADSVAAVRAQAVDHQITSAQRDSIRRVASQQQVGIASEITARGGHVLASFRDAINGVKIDIDEAQVEALRTAAGVVAVRAVRKYRKNNTESVPFIGAPVVWQTSPNFRGEGKKIAVIDTGIDYTHANFGGPGTVAAFDAAKATNTQPADPSLFGPNAPKVKGGTDLVGDDYNADDDTSVPVPDPNPLDCDGHGSHTAGTAAGFGVGADGKTYKGPYNSAAYSSQQFIIGPGVAPKADLYSVRVFGCLGSTNVVVDAIDWAIAHDMDVISMSLGSPLGTAEDADAVASANAAKAGVIVVAASGNDGPAPYITSTPGVSDGAISIAAVDSHESFPGALLTLNNGPLQTIDANGAQLPGPVGVVVLHNPDGTLSLGCSESEYVDSLIAGKLVVTLRGTCARVDRATFGQKHGAAAVLMVNTDPGYPPYEGPIPDVTIPFLGATSTDKAQASAATSVSAFVANVIANPTFRNAANFSSGGPRFGDSVLKPNVSAPGVSIFSTASGTGNQGLFESGTSMATPHVAGVAALASQAHPKWDERSVRAAIVQTASPKLLNDYTPALEGSGLVQPLGATRTQAVVFAEGKSGVESISFGFEEFLRDFHSDRDVTVRNLGDSPIVFKVTSTKTGGVPHKLHLSDSTIVVGAHRDAKLEVTLSVPVETVGATHDPDGNPLFPEVAGYVTFTPSSSSMNGGVTLNVPYYLVPRARSNVGALLAGRLSPSHPNANVLLANVLGAIPGTGDFYAWGLTSKRQGIKYFDTRAVGVQSNLIPGTTAGSVDSVLVFAVNTFERFSAASMAEFDILIDVDGDKKPDFVVVGADLGALTAGAYNGQFASALFDLKTGDGFIEALADAPTDGSTVLLPVWASDMGITPANPRFSYTETTYNLSDLTSANMPGTGTFNAFTPSITNAKFVTVDRNRAAVVPVSIDPNEWKKTPALGLMVVSEDNQSGGDDQGILIPAK